MPGFSLTPNLVEVFIGIVQARSPEEARVGKNLPGGPPGSERRQNIEKTCDRSDAEVVEL